MKKFTFIFVTLVLLNLIAVGCTQQNLKLQQKSSKYAGAKKTARKYTVPKQKYKAKGIASWYGKRFHRKKTSNGEKYDMYAMTAAHPTLPINSYARVKNLQNGRYVVVRINDRGPYFRRRIIDLSYAAARKLGLLSNGLAMVEVEAV